MKRLIFLLVLVFTFVLALASCDMINPDNENGDGDECTNSEHNFGEWEIITEPTCVKDGLRERYCTCGEKESEEIAANGHVMKGNVCIVCGKTFSEGLEFRTYHDGTCYVAGIGSCTDLDIIIPPVSPEGDIVIAVGEAAFHINFNITSVYIPESVTKIYPAAFYGCEQLEYIRIPDTVTEIGGKNFAHCAFTTFRFGENSQIKVLDEGLFDGCKSLVDIDIPESVEEIGFLTFRGCTSLETIEISANVKKIGWMAFNECSSLINIKVDEENEHFKTIDGHLYSKDGKTLIQYAEGQKLKCFDIPEGVTTIGAYAFLYSDISAIKIPISLTEIQAEAIYICPNISDIYYCGSKEDWAKIDINSSNADLEKVTIHYDYIPKG